MSRARQQKDTTATGSVEIWDLREGDAAGVPLPGDGPSGPPWPDPRSRDPELAAEWTRLQPRLRLAEGLRRMRLARGLTQSELAGALDTRQPDIARMESINGPWPSVHKVADYAEACGFKLTLQFSENTLAEASQTDAPPTTGVQVVIHPEEDAMQLAIEVA